jgi:hypothetical protein
MSSLPVPFLWLVLCLCLCWCLYARAATWAQQAGSTRLLSRVAQAKLDSHTFWVYPTRMTMTTSTYQQLRFDPLRDASHREPT